MDMTAVRSEARLVPRATPFIRSMLCRWLLFQALGG